MGKQRRRACRRAAQQRKEAAAKATAAKIEAPKVVEAPKAEKLVVAEVSKKRAEAAPERVDGPLKGVSKKAKAPAKKGRFRKKKEE
jgi:hypothetical protein